MRIRVLGQIEAADDRLRPLGGPTQRRIMAILALHHGDVVSVDRLVDATWADDVPARAERNVHSYIHRLRQSLNGAGDLIETVGDGYRLRVSDDDLDIEQFETLVATAHRLAERDDVTEALDAVREATGLWHGRPFGEFADEPWAEAEAHRLTELHVSLCELRCDLLLRVGRPHEAIAELERLVAEHPLRERPRSLQMQSLYHGGRHAEALRAFQQFRRHLLDEVGVGPSDDLVDLDRRIASGSLDAPTSSGTRTVGAYQLAERIGEGAFAVVHRATHTTLRRDVAIKIIRAELANQPEFVRRFTAEAQMVARIEHPNVVPLYDYWREPDHAYLVMRLMSGGTLEQRLDRGPFPVADAVDVVEQIASALDAAHQLGVVHRDVKPENIMFDAEGRAHLGDFGIALEAAERSRPEAALSEGSPLFASPEQLRREPAGPEADVFALGVVAFTMLVGAAPFADARDEAERLRRQLGDPVPTVSRSRGDVPVGVDDVISVATAKDPLERFASAGAFAAAFRAAAQAGDGGRARISTFAGHRNPYKGLRPFDEADAADFFGRARLVDELTGALTERSVVAVVGPSGAGKSSAVRAGLLPALRRGGVRGSREWFVTTMIPGREPFESLETALLRVAVNPPGTLLDQLRSSPRGLLRGARRVLPDDSAVLLLVIDQFEELFTHTVDPGERDAFLQALVTATSEPGSPVRLVLTLRADFYDRPLRHPVFAPLLKRSAVTVTPLAPDELERAIVQPADSVGVEFEPGLVARMVADFTSRPGALPLLQYTLTRLLDGSDDPVLRESDYEAMGGLAGSLGGRAEELWNESDPAEQQAARRIFQRLVALGEGTEDTRRRVLLSELDGGSTTDAVLDRLVAARLVMLDRDPASREPTVEVAHEALITHWPRLREWLDEDRDALRAHRHLTTASTTWVERRREPSELYRGSRLDQVEQLVMADRIQPNEAEAEFLAASVERRDAEEHDRRQRSRRLRRFAVTAAVLAVFAVAASVVAVIQRNTAADNRTLAERRAMESDVLRLTAESDAALGADPDLAILLALEAYDRAAAIGDVPSRVVSALQTAVQSSRLVERLPEGSDAAVMSPDGALLAVGSNDDEGVVIVYDRQYQEVTRFDSGAEVGQLTFSPDGTVLAVSAYHMWDFDYYRDIDDPDVAPSRLYDTSTFELLGDLAGPCCLVTADLHFSPDGEFVAGMTMPRTPSDLPRGYVWRTDAPSESPLELSDTGVVGFLGASGLLAAYEVDDPAQLSLEDDLRLRFLDPRTGQEASRHPVDVAGFLATSPTDDRFLVMNDNSISIWNAGDDEPIETFDVDSSAHGAQFSARGDEVVVRGDDSDVVVVDLGTGEQTALPGHGGGGAFHVSTNTADRRLVAAAGSGETLVWELGPAGPDALGNIAAQVGPGPARLRVDASGRLVTSEAAEGGWRVRVHDPATGAIVAESEPFVSPPVVSASATTIAGRTAEGTITVVQLGDAASAIGVAHGCDPLAVDDAGVRLALSCGDVAGELVDVWDGSVVHVWDTFIDAGFGPAGSVTDGVIATTVGQRVLELRRAADGALIDRVELPGEYPFVPTFSSDGRGLAFGSSAGGGRAVDVAAVMDGTPLADALLANPRVEGGPTNVTRVEGDMLVTAHSGEMLRMWHAIRGELAIELPMTTGWNGSPHVLTPDGRDLYYYGRDGVLARFPTSGDELADLARTRVQRGFTPDECRRYFPAGDCPTS